MADLGSILRQGAGLIGSANEAISSFGQLADLIKRGVATTKELDKLASEIKGDTRAEIGGRKESKEAALIETFLESAGFTGLDKGKKDGKLSQQEVANIKEFLKDKPELAKEVTFKDNEIVFTKKAMEMLKATAEQQKAAGQEHGTTAPAAPATAASAPTAQAPAASAPDDSCKKNAAKVGKWLGKVGVTVNSDMGGAACDAMNKPKAEQQQTPG